MSGADAAKIVLPTKIERRRTRWRQAKQAQRQRERDGKMTVAIEIGGELVELLVRLRWLDRARDGDRRAISDAIERMLAASARAR